MDLIQWIQLVDRLNNHPTGIIFDMLFFNLKQKYVPNIRRIDNVSKTQP